MAKCLKCGKNGVFLKVIEGKLCESCYAEYVSVARRNGEILHESIAIINKSSNPETVLSRVGVAQAAAEAIAPYARMGIATALRLQALEALPQLQEFPNKVLRALLSEERPKARAKSNAAKTRAGKIGPYQKLLDKLYKIQHHYDDMTLFETLEREVLQEMDQVHIEALMLEAEKEEFKGNTRKALDKYKDALFEIRKDRIDDDLQRSLIERIEGCIGRLGDQQARVQ
jgi:hypothetical protein